MTIPLLTDKEGNKFGKSTGGGALWLDVSKTTPYNLYQYLLNTSDSEIEDLLYRLTFLDGIEHTISEHLKSPEKRIG